MTGVIVNVDTSGLRKIIRRLDSEKAENAKKTLQPAVKKAAIEVMTLLPRDTRRLARGWAQAINGAGVGPVFVPTVRASTGPFQEKFRARMISEAQFWDKVARKWERRLQRSTNAALARGGKRPKLRELTMLATRTRKLADRSAQELAKLDDTSIIILGRTVKRKFGVSQLITVRNKIFGGQGSQRTIGGVFFFEMVNKEPHARIIESRSKHWRNAIGRQLQPRLISKSYLKRLQRAGLDTTGLGRSAA